MGISNNPNKKINLTVYDNIEKSNLSRENDKGRLKSEYNVKTEIIFKKEFFKSKMPL